VGNDWVSSPEFWKMAPGQVWWLIEAKTPDHVKTRGDDFAEVRRMIDRAKMEEAQNV
jgi:hypothetical protein